MVEKDFSGRHRPYRHSRRDHSNGIYAYYQFPQAKRDDSLKVRPFERE